MGWRPACEAVCYIAGYSDSRLLTITRGLYDPELEKDACGVGFAW